MFPVLKQGSLQPSATFEWAQVSLDQIVSKGSFQPTFSPYSKSKEETKPPHPNPSSLHWKAETFLFFFLLCYCQKNACLV